MANWPNPAAEAALVQGLRARDPEAAVVLVQTFLAELQWTACGCGLQEQDAFAVANEALTRAFFAIDSYAPQPGATFRSWLFRILMNRIRDFARAQKRRLVHEVSSAEFVDDEDADSDLVDEVLPPVRRQVLAVPASATDAVPATSPVAVLTTALLDRMSKREREVMIRTAKGMPDEEIAADLQMKVGAVRVARRRARSRAADDLKEIAPTLDETIHRRLRKLLSQRGTAYD